MKKPAVRPAVKRTGKSPRIGKPTGRVNQAHRMTMAEGLYRGSADLSGKSHDVGTLLRKQYP